MNKGAYFSSIPIFILETNGFTSRIFVSQLLPDNNIYKSKLRSVVLKAYTGPVFEFIVNSKVNGYTENLHPTNNFQTGWTVGANLRFLYLLSARVAYTYYPYSLFQKDDLYRRALSFSLGF